MADDSDAPNSDDNSQLQSDENDISSEPSELTKENMQDPKFESEGNEKNESPPPPPGFDNTDIPPPPPGFGSFNDVNRESEELGDIGDLLSGENIGNTEFPTIDEKEMTSKSQVNLNEIEDFDNAFNSLSDSISILGRESIDKTDSSSEITEKNYFPSSSEFDDTINSFGLVTGSEEQQFSKIEQPRPSPFLRSHIEVDSIPGDKLYATLSESETSTLNPDGSVRKQVIDGELILRNASKKHRAWDIEVHLESTDSTDFSDKVSTVRELDPTEETVIPYTASGPKMLVLREKIDTEPTREQESSLSLVYSKNPQEISIQIEVENVSPVALYDVEVKRTIPSSFILPDDREYNVEGESIVWDIGKMNIGQTKTITFTAEVITESIGKIKSGICSSTYSAEATASRIRFDRVFGSGRQFSYVNAVEDDRPGVWHCTCVFENKSSFVVALSGATVKLVGRTDPILEVSDIRQDVPPEGRWDSMSKRVESDDQPSFTQEVRFSILPRVSVQSSGNIELKEQQLTVLDAVLQKRFDKSRIKSYLSSNVEVVISLENTGSSPINVIRVLDDIPGIFDTPSMEQVSIEMEGSELSSSQYRIDIVNGIQIEEKHLSPDGDGHGLRITVGTSAPLGLHPGKSIIIRYPLTAPDPSPRNKLLVAPIRVDFSSERFGPVATRLVERPPQIKVVHKRRNISTGKEVFPGSGPGGYEILLMFHNNSDSALEDLALHDIVPGTFSIEKYTIRGNDGEIDASLTKESARDGTQVTWAIGRIQKDERIEVLYSIQGDPESEYKVSDAQDFHGATFGDEVDEEPNLPEWIERDESENILPPSDSLDDVIVEQINSEENEIEEISKEKIDSVEENEISEQTEDYGPATVCPACGSEENSHSSKCSVCGHIF